jgi:hypothetical protein
MNGSATLKIRKKARASRGQQEFCMSGSSDDNGLLFENRVDRSGSIF